MGCFDTFFINPGFWLWPYFMLGKPTRPNQQKREFSFLFFFADALDLRENWERHVRDVNFP